MTRFLMTAAFAGLVAALPAAAEDHAQLAASAGLTADEAQQMSLGAIAAAKFNRDTGADNRQTAPSARAPIAADPIRHAQLIAAADLTPGQARGMTVADLAVAKANAEADGDNRQTPVTLSSRGPIAMVPAQLAAAAGLTPEEARGMTLNQIVERAHHLHASGDNRQ